MEKFVIFLVFAIVIFQVYRNIKLKMMIEKRRKIVMLQIVNYLVLVIGILTGSILSLILALIIMLVIILISFIKYKN